MGPNDYPDDIELGIAHQDLDTRITLRCGCSAWADSLEHDVDACAEDQAAWLSEQEARRRAAYEDAGFCIHGQPKFSCDAKLASCEATVPVDGIAAARAWEASQEVR